MRSHIFVPLLLAVLAVLAGCRTMEPQYTQPKAPVSGAWPSGAAYPKAADAAVSTEAPALEWQAFIGDEKLQQVIEMGLTNNLDLRIAALNVERARAQYGVQRSQLLPAINAAGSESKQRIPADLSSSGTRITSEQYGVNAGIAAWEIDFFGRIRSLKKAALQQYLATEQARRAARLLLVSSIANAYYGLAADRENLQIAETTLETQQGIFNLVKRRFEAGVVAELDVHRAQTQVDTARGDMARFTQQVAQDKNALDLLVGAPVPEERLPANLAGVGLPKDISAGTSSEVLLSRPDVLQAEHLLKAANANIGAARAAFFPRIALTGSAGTASSDLSGLFESGSGTWAYAPQIVLPIFDARIWAAARVSKADKEIAVAQYEKAIQNAFKEVADALAVRGTIGQQVASQESLVHSVSETYRLSNIRYDKGVDSYLNVLDAQRTLYAAQQGLVSLHRAAIANQVRLYAVLGGGCEEKSCDVPPKNGENPPKTGEAPRH